MDSKPEQVELEVQNNKGTKKNWIIGSVIGVVLLAVVVITFGHSIFAKLAPDKYVLISMGNMQKLAEKETKKSTYIMPRNKRVTTEFTLTDLIGEGFDTYKDILIGGGVSLVLSNSKDDDIIIDAGVTQGGTNLMTLSLYSSETELGVKIPGLLEQYVTAELPNFKEQYDESNLSRFLGDIKEEDVTLMTDAITQLRAAIINDIGADTIVKEDSALANEIELLTREFVEGIDVKHIGSTKVVIGDKEKKANQFLATVDGTEFKAFVTDVTKAVLNSDEMAKTLAINEATVSKQEFEDMIDEAMAQIDFSQVEMVYTIDHKMRIVGVETATTATVQETDVQLDLNYYLSGADSIFDTMAINLKADSDLETMTFDIGSDKTYANNKTKTSQDINIKATIGDAEAINMLAHTDIDSKATEDNLAISLTATIFDTTNFSMNLLGDYLVNEAEKEISLVASSMDLTLEEEGNIMTIGGSAVAKIENLKDESLAVPKEEQLDLFSLDLSQMLDLVGRFSNQMNKLGKITNKL